MRDGETGDAVEEVQAVRLDGEGDLLARRRAELLMRDGDDGPCPQFAGDMRLVAEPLAG
jgi:hypothetical protein